VTPIHEDHALAGRAAGGEEAAWREIYTATRQRLFALLCYQVGDRTEALDVLQDTYLAAVRGIGAYRGEASLESWLSGIALRRARDWKRRFLPRWKRTAPLEEGFGVEDVRSRPDPDEGRALNRALGKLPERQRNAVLLHESMGYSFREVAATIGVSEATARVHCFRGRETLRGLLSQKESEEGMTPAAQEQQS
jgi:RNA polymerase sigma-70 factor (ECF subfamily)